MVLRDLLKRMFLLLTWPLRYCVRYELRRQFDAISVAQDIQGALQRRATDSTAAYVEKNMGSADSVSSQLELLTTAYEAADLGKNTLVCEFGVWTGNSINHLASLIDGKVYGFDSFQGLPQRWRDGFDQGKFRLNAEPQVQANVVLVKGWFHETIPVFKREHSEMVGLLHVDCDLYESTQTIFDLMGDRITSGTIVVFDEYFNYPGWTNGEFRAFQEFVARRGLVYEYLAYNRNHEQVAVRIGTGNS